MNGDPFDPTQLIPQVLRTVAASTADTNQRNHVAAMEAAEMAAWDAYALAWVRENESGYDDDFKPEPISARAADFADKMIDRRRKYFEIGPAGVAVASPPSVGTTVATAPQKPET